VTRWPRAVRFAPVALLWATPAAAAPAVADAPGGAASILGAAGGTAQLVLLVAGASLLPAVVLACTCFPRFAIVFALLRSGLGTAGAPPAPVLAGLALFMSLFVMWPVLGELHGRALEPYLAGRMDAGQALQAGTPPLRRFLLARTREADLALFYEVSGAARPRTAEDVPLRIAVPAFVVSELGTAFRIGLVVLLPFLVIDLIVAVVLSSLGMIMVPPALVALPVKLLVFVCVDGWHLLVASLLKGAM
jgi:flagellar biosynthetic protein FliP